MSQRMVAVAPRRISPAALMVCADGIAVGTSFSLTHATLSAAAMIGMFLGLTAIGLRLDGREHGRVLVSILGLGGIVLLLLRLRAAQAMGQAPITGALGQDMMLMLAMASLLTAGARSTVLTWIAQPKGRRITAPRGVLLGNGVEAAALLARATDADRLLWLGYADDQPSATRALPYLGDIGSVIALIGQGRVDQVTLLPDQLRHLPRLSVYAVELRLAVLPVGQKPRLAPVLPPPLTDAGKLVKRAEDIMFASLILLAFAIPILVIALAIWRESGSPVLFRQRRIGLNGVPFTLLKFRTLRADLADPLGALPVQPNDPRVTRFGRLLRQTSLDELPQLLNVLHGEMALVGPRPHAIGTCAEGRRLDTICSQYPARHRMLPGLTGLAQVNGLRGPLRTEAAVIARTRADLVYIATWSLWRDLLILYRTPWTVALMRNAL